MLRVEPCAGAVGALESLLIDTIGEGRSLQSIQELSYAAMLDGTKSILAELGCSGEYPSNVERDLRRRCKRAMGIALEPYPIDVTVKQHGALLPLTINVLLPHEVFSHLFHYDEQMFHHVFYENALEYWGLEFENRSDWLVSHPLYQAVADSPGSFSPLEAVWGWRSGEQSWHSWNHGIYLGFGQLPCLYKAF